MSKTMGIVGKTRPILNTNTLLTLYFAMFLLYLDDMIKHIKVLYKTYNMYNAQKGNKDMKKNTNTIKIQG